MEQEGRNVRPRVTTQPLQATLPRERVTVRLPPTENANLPPQVTTGLTLETLLAQLTTQISAVSAEITPLRVDVQTLAGRVACLEEEEIFGSDGEEQEEEPGAPKLLGKGERAGSRRNSAAQARGIVSKFEKKPNT